MVRKICRECSTEDAVKNRLLYAGHGQWVCRNELNCEHRKRRHDALIERTLLALAGNDPKPQLVVDAPGWYNLLQQQGNGFRNSWSDYWERPDPWPGKDYE